MADKPRKQRQTSKLGLRKKRKTNESALARIVTAAAKGIDGAVERSRARDADDFQQKMFEVCREAAWMQARGRTYAEIAEHQGCAQGTAFRRVQKWYRDIERHEDFEHNKRKSSARIDAVFRQLLSDREEIEQDPEMAPAAKLALKCRITELMHENIELQAKILGVLLPSSLQMNLGQNAGATMVDARRIEMPDDRDTRDLIVGRLREVRALVEGSSEQ